MIDMHIHAVNPHLPDSGPFYPVVEGPPEEVAEQIRAEMEDAGIEQVLAMGRLGTSPDDPLGITETLRIAEHLPQLHPIGIADPTRISSLHLRQSEKALQSGRVKALKAYLGYLHVAPTSPAYLPYYKLAARYDIPFIFHTGDTYSPSAKVRFAHPLPIDDIAVDHPEVNFVLAHCGNPWLIDAAEVVYKNENVWADLSGLLVEEGETFPVDPDAEAIAELRADVGKAFRYTGKPDRFLYGSDWPLAPMKEYLDLIALIIPEEHHSAVFRDNARNLFDL